MSRLAARLPGMAVTTTDTFGLDAECVEATAFAWLAMCHEQGLPGNLPAVTGARRPVVLGGRYPAS
jgi:anhydro-N-acetylmuramic acid kinase